MSVQRKANGNPAKKRLFGWWAAGLVGLAAFVVVSSRHELTTTQRGETGRLLTGIENSTNFAAYAKTGTCQSCHEEAFQLWETSHHALAERPASFALDSRGFEPPAKISHGSQASEARGRNQHFEVRTIGRNGQLQ